MCIYVYMCIYIYIERERVVYITLPASVRKSTPFTRAALPCNAAAETSSQPLIWYYENRISNVSSSPEESFFFTDTHVASCL